MFGFVAVTALALAAVAGWNIGENMTVSLVCGGAAVLVLLAWGVFELVRSGRTVQRTVAPPPPAKKAYTYLRKTGDGLPYNYHGSRMNQVSIVSPSINDQAAVKVIKESLEEGNDSIRVAIHYLDGTIAFLVDGKKIAERSDSGVQVIADWLKQKKPYYAVIVSFIEGTGLEIAVGLYQDRRHGQENREQTTHTLIDYLDAKTQETLKSVWKDDEVLYKASNALAGVVVIFHEERPIGKLPASIAARFAEQEPYGVFVESVALTADGKYRVPTVRIYW